MFKVLGWSSLGLFEDPNWNRKVTDDFPNDGNYAEDREREWIKNERKKDTEWKKVNR
jgi:hypothetical protein